MGTNLPPAGTTDSNSKRLRLKSGIAQQELTGAAEAFPGAKKNAKAEVAPAGKVYQSRARSAMMRASASRSRVSMTSPGEWE